MKTFKTITILGSIFAFTACANVNSISVEVAQQKADEIIKYQEKNNPTIKFGMSYTFTLKSKRLETRTYKNPINNMKWLYIQNFELCYDAKTSVILMKSFTDDGAVKEDVVSYVFPATLNNEKVIVSSLSSSKGKFYNKETVPVGTTIEERIYSYALELSNSILEIDLYDKKTLQRIAEYGVVTYGYEEYNPKFSYSSKGEGNLIGSMAVNRTEEMEHSKCTQEVRVKYGWDNYLLSEIYTKAEVKDNAYSNFKDPIYAGFKNYKINEYYYSFKLSSSVKAISLDGYEFDPELK